MNEADFLLSHYDYPLPKEHIAHHLANPRESARLLVYERSSGQIWHTDFYHFCDFVPRNTLIIMNDTKVIKARLYAHKIDTISGITNKKRMEIFFHTFVCEDFNQPHSTLQRFSHANQNGTKCKVQIKGRIKAGDWLRLDSQYYAYIESCLEDGMRIVYFAYFKDKFSPERLNEQKIFLDKNEVLTLLEKYGNIPLPPYIKRASNEQDNKDYQSVFATHPGAVAAPTASLHFSKQSLDSICAQFQVCFITLHVGAGTFWSVESEDIRKHCIHTESYSIQKQTAQCIENAHQNNYKILCIGTTAARCVEYYARYKILCGECDIFLYPGQQFLQVDYLLTNFHLPKSTLLMLVSAMIGREKCLEIYSLALKEGYKFYSYGDGMLIL